MPVVKGGVWSNIEDEILKASVSKYGLNQWARVSSLLARKTPKQCKARWTEWLDPSIKKIEWNKEEDEKLLHLAKLMPTQWRTIAPIVGRTANQCLERYQKLLDEAEQRESAELGLTGTDSAGAPAPTADYVRRLRPGEIDPNPETKPARPDTIDLDEDEKEMLSEARARLANTQGKKAKRKARERQQEESRRLAALQKRRELKVAGINVKVTTRKPGQMDYNADIPFEKKPALGFYDTNAEIALNERQRANFDPKKLQIGGKRKDEADEDAERKKRKQDKDGSSASVQAALKAGQLQKMREADQSNKRKPLNLPAPQVGDAELEEIVMMGVAGDKAARLAGGGKNDATRGLIGSYTNLIPSATPIRTPMAPASEDRVANEIRNIRALTETQSALLGGENAALLSGTGSTGFQGVAPTKHAIATPNPLATPFRMSTVAGATPLHSVGLTPSHAAGTTPFKRKGESDEDAERKRPKQDGKAGQMQSSRLRFMSLPAPEVGDAELEELVRVGFMGNKAASNTLDDDNDGAQAVIGSATEPTVGNGVNSSHDTTFRAIGMPSKTNPVIRTPRPYIVDVEKLLVMTKHNDTPLGRARALIGRETVALIANEAAKFPLPESKIIGKPPKLRPVTEQGLVQAKLLILEEARSKPSQEDIAAAWMRRGDKYPLEKLGVVTSHGGETANADAGLAKHSVALAIRARWDQVQDNVMAMAENSGKVEKKLNVLTQGYGVRAKTLTTKLLEVTKELEEAKTALIGFRSLQVAEQEAIARRLEQLRGEVSFIFRREREAQEKYRKFSQF